MKIILGTVVERIASLKDGTFSITLSTQEIEPDDVGKVFSLRNKFVKTLLSDNNISELQEQMIDEEQMPDGRKVKSRSAKLRAVLFIQHQHTDTDLTFDQFYADYMDELIANVKLKLPK